MGLCLHVKLPNIHFHIWFFFYSYQCIVSWRGHTIYISFRTPQNQNFELPVWPHLCIPVERQTCRQDWMATLQEAAKEFGKGWPGSGHGGTCWLVCKVFSCPSLTCPILVSGIAFFSLSFSETPLEDLAPAVAPCGAWASGLQGLVQCLGQFNKFTF